MDFEAALEKMSPVTLEEMDGIRLMNRIDSKYLTDEATLLGILSDAAAAGSVLQVLSLDAPVVGQVERPPGPVIESGSFGPRRIGLHEAPAGVESRHGAGRLRTGREASENQDAEKSKQSFHHDYWLKPNKDTLFPDKNR